MLYVLHLERRSRRRSDVLIWQPAHLSAGHLQRKAKGSAAEAELPAVLTNRDMSLDPFHALGKLLYNKRLGEPDAAGQVRLHVACLLCAPCCRAMLLVPAYPPHD